MLLDQSVRIERVLAKTVLQSRQRSRFLAVEGVARSYISPYKIGPHPMVRLIGGITLM